MATEQAEQTGRAVTETETRLAKHYASHVALLPANAAVESTGGGLTAIVVGCLRGGDGREYCAHVTNSDASLFDPESPSADGELEWSVELYDTDGAWLEGGFDRDISVAWEQTRTVLAALKP